MKLRLLTEEEAKQIRASAQRYLHKQHGKVMFESTSLPEAALVEFIAFQKGCTFFRCKEGLEIDQPWRDYDPPTESEWKTRALNAEDNEKDLAVKILDLENENEQLREKVQSAMVAARVLKRTLLGEES